MCIRDRPWLSQSHQAEIRFWINVCSRKRKPCSSISHTCCTEYRTFDLSTCTCCLHVPPDILASTAQRRTNSTRRHCRLDKWASLLLAAVEFPLIPIFWIPLAIHKSGRSLCSAADTPSSERLILRLWLPIIGEDILWGQGVLLYSRGQSYFPLWSYSRMSSTILASKDRFTASAVASLPCR